MKYRITAQTTIEIVTIVKAKSEEEAINIAMDRDVFLCIHGSELVEKDVSDEEFVLIDGSHNGIECLEAEKS